MPNRGDEPEIVTNATVNIAKSGKFSTFSTASFYVKNYFSCVFN